MSRTFQHRRTPVKDPRETKENIAELKHYEGAVQEALEARCKCGWITSFKNCPMCGGNK